MKKESLKNKKSLVVICACLLLLIPALDHLTKYLVRTLMTVGDSRPVFGDFFHLTYILNDGMAFGALGGGWRWVFMILTPLTLGVLAFVFFKFFNRLHALTAVSMVMIFAGGLSNMVDRIFFTDLTNPPTKLFDGRVIDFFDFNITVFGRRIWNAVFNVADAFVVVGVFLLLAAIIITDVKERKAKKAGKAKNDAGGAETDMDLEAAPPAPEAPDDGAGETGGDGGGDAGDL